MTLTITEWSAISPYGLDRAAFAAAVRSGRPNTADPAVVPDFQIREVLGRKGTRAMDRLTALAVATAGQLLRGPDGERIAGVGPRTALVFGTNAASVKSAMDFTRDSLTEAKPYFVDPAQFPNTVLNCAAAQCAIWHRLKGPNTTVSGGRATGLLALNYARRLRNAGRAGTVVCGAAEEFSEARAWLETDAVLGEGCAMLLLEGVEGNRPPLAEVLAVELAVSADPQEPQTTLMDCAQRALKSRDESPWAVVSSGGPGEADLFTDVPVRLDSTALLGDTHAASVTFGIAALLARAAGDPAAHGRTALVTAADRDGQVGCALLRLGGNP